MGDSINHTELLLVLKKRFEANMSRHIGLDWSKVEKKLESSSDKLWSLWQMEKTGGEPDVVDYDIDSNEFIFMDCSPESPAGRRSLCYDRAALDSRKSFKPVGSAIDLAETMKVDILTEDQYRQLQKLGHFDTKTSSWLSTPEEIRKLGGAIFADFRYGKVFVYHNGAESYYGSRSFRTSLRV